MQQLRSVSFFSFTKLILLNCLLVYVSSAKWCSIDVAWRRSTDSVPSKASSLAITGVGFALGTFLPVQFAMATARTFGTFVHGNPVKRGMVGTMFEQSFDLLVAAALLVASVATWYSREGPIVWTLSAAAMLTVTTLMAGPLVRLARQLAALSHNNLLPLHNRIAQSFSELQHSGLLNTQLVRRLVLFSAARFAIVVLTSTQTAEAVGLHIPLWQMAATIPFVVLASVLALTPGGLGVNELTSATALRSFGTPLAVGAQWALANRVLVAASYLLVGTCAAVGLFIHKLAASRPPEVMEAAND